MSQDRLHKNFSASNTVLEPAFLDGIPSQKKAEVAQENISGLSPLVQV